MGLYSCNYSGASKKHYAWAHCLTLPSRVNPAQCSKLAAQQRLLIAPIVAGGGAGVCSLTLKLRKLEQAGTELQLLLRQHCF